MKITLEGSVNELGNLLRSVGIPKELIIDDGEKFVKFDSRKNDCIDLEMMKENAIKNAMGGINLFKNDEISSKVSRQIRDMKSAVLDKKN